ncbi:UNVERIFIED_ORG: hypothetical protein [Escherichia phage CMSTMSU]
MRNEYVFGPVGKQNSTLIWHEIIFKIISKSFTLKDIINTDQDRLFFRSKI